MHSRAAPLASSEFVLKGSLEYCYVRFHRVLGLFGVVCGRANFFLARLARDHVKGEAHISV